ncbi:Uncharacterized protein TCM_038489 [Theobroma cacao]|uniref:Prolamin-like domain-containing protein n=1 Tax=Theobroma cacao TaxID=3641 RepID=A0A061GWS5_THECC|nr:Uncharacterized protein TCM_038489 [Theobroma cacao]
MLKFTTCTILLAILSVCKQGITSAALANKDMEPFIAPEPYFDDEVGYISPSAVTDDMAALSPEAQDVEDLYERCAMVLGEDCGGEIFDLIFRNDAVILNGNLGIELVSKNCCGKLMSMGPHCHDQLFNLIAQTPEFSTNSSATAPRSSQVWELCSIS